LRHHFNYKVKELKFDFRFHSSTFAEELWFLLDFIPSGLKGNSVLDFNF